MEVAASQGELFPVLQEKVRKRSPLWHYVKATTQHGPLAPPAMVAASLGISRQRVYQLMDEGRLESIEVDGKKFIPAHKLEEFLLIARKSGQHSEFHVPERYSEFLERWKAA